VVFIRFDFEARFYIFFAVRTRPAAGRVRHAWPFVRDKVINYLSVFGNHGRTFKSYLVPFHCFHDHPIGLVGKQFFWKFGIVGFFHTGWRLEGRLRWAEHRRNSRFRSGIFFQLDCYISKIFCLLRILQTSHTRFMKVQIYLPTVKWWFLNRCFQDYRCYISLYVTSS
jgi:hypothetical protein